MKALKIFILTGLLLMFLAAGAVGYVWFKLQGTLNEVTADPKQQQEVVDFVQSDDTPVANTVPEEGIQIDISSVSDEQKAAAEKIGIDLDTMVLTPEIISCAEQKLGSERIEEIMRGSSPTTIESISLLPCL